MELVAKTKEIIDFFDSIGVLIGWVLENPMSDIHTHNKWLGDIKYKFNPCDHAGFVCNDNNKYVLSLLAGKESLTKEDYQFIANTNAYNKTTWLWGKFNKPMKNRIEPVCKESPIWKLYGGRSLKTKNARAITPAGFAYSFYLANN